MNATFSATVLHVSNLEQSLHFYTKTLGFDEAFNAGAYAGVCAGVLMIHLCAPANQGIKKPIGAGHICILTDKADHYYQHLISQNVQIVYPIGDRDYGIRDFAVSDLDGNTLIFGEELKEIR